MIQILPGTHVDVVAGDRTQALTVTGIVAMPLDLDWGAELTIINQGDSTNVSLGYDLSDVKMKLVNEVMNYANTLYLYRSNLTGAAKATGLLATGITATAKCFGLHGNDISVTVTGTAAPFTIKTFVSGVLKDTQTVATPAAFVANDWITISGTGTLVSATVTMAGGTNGTTDTTVDAFVAAIQKYQLNVVAYTGATPAIITGLTAYVNDQRNKNNMIQFVQSGTAANNVAIYNVMSGGITANYTLTAPEACATIAGIIAMQGIKGSLTYFGPIVGWTDIPTVLTYEQQKSAVIAGQLIVVMLYGVPTVLYDINSLTTFTATSPKDWCKGLVIRTLDSVAISVKKLTDTRAIGKLRRSVNGRLLVKGMIATMVDEDYQKNGYIEDFTADDVAVDEGTENDSIVSKVNTKVVDTMDKAQITVISL